MTSAEYWGEMLREMRNDPDGCKFNDLSEWLHCYGSEDHEVINSYIDEEDRYCYHVFGDASILDCKTGAMVTFEDAAKKIGSAEVTIGLLWNAWECLKSGYVVPRRSSMPN
jgi:hypothetical protein